MYNLKILFFDKNFLALSKPPGLDIKNILKNKFKNNIPNNGILNRLDKYTSGIILIARNLMFYYFYKKLLILNLIKKKYSAIIKNYKEMGFINLSINKKKNIFIKKISKKSITFYKIFKKRKIFLVNIYIKTGRTHQIRKHLNYIGLNLKNEFYYDKKIKFINTLHFKKVFFYYPLYSNFFSLSCSFFKEMRKLFLINFLL